MNRNIHVVSFGTTNTYKRSLKRIKQEAIDFGFFVDNIHIFTENDLPPEIKRKFKCENTRGYGYWMWKPFVLSTVCSRIPNDDILLYIDCGSTLNKNGKERFQYYVEYMNVHDMLCFNTRYFPNQLDRYYEKQWSKMDLIDFLNAKHLLDSIQLQASHFFIKNTTNICSFLNSWLDIGYIDNNQYSNDKNSLIENHVSFKEHRHDQSIFSILCKTRIENIKILEDEMIYPLVVKGENIHNYPILTTRLRM